MINKIIDKIEEFFRRRKIKALKEKLTEHQFIHYFVWHDWYKIVKWSVPPEFRKKDNQWDWWYFTAKISDPFNPNDFRFMRTNKIFIEIYFNEIGWVQCEKHD